MTASTRTPKSDVTYYTVSDHRFFLGTVALLNSLRVTANEGELVVLDAGLTPTERELLGDHATLVHPPKQTEGTQILLMKPYPRFFDPTGTVVLIDSDIVVTDSLDPVLDLAHEGKICACPAWTLEARTRWFADWETTLGLRSPLRREDWVHNGFVVFTTEHWPHLLERWWQVCELDPIHDADALNALLMSEIPRDVLALLPEGEEAFGGDIAVENLETLSCSLDGEPTRILHYPDNPKPWERSGWMRLAATDYLRLMRRLLFATDVPLRLDPDLAPVWLRPDLRGDLALRSLGALNRTIVWSSHMVPESMGERLRRVRRKLA